ncbi:ABC transporter permease subunit [Conexibacter sp. W3-3-2]|nr:ABC transporter permease subunit [Conexibacter sp. W3-3-2]
MAAGGVRVRPRPRPHAAPAAQLRRAARVRPREPGPCDLPGTARLHRVGVRAAGRRGEGRRCRDALPARARAAALPRRPLLPEVRGGADPPLRGRRGRPRDVLRRRVRAVRGPARHRAAQRPAVRARRRHAAERELRRDPRQRGQRGGRPGRREPAARPAAAGGQGRPRRAGQPDRPAARPARPRAAFRVHARGPQPVPARRPRRGAARARRRRGRTAGAALDARGPARRGDVRTAGARGRVAVLPAAALVALLLGGALAGAVRASVTPLGGEPTLVAWRDLLAAPEFRDAVVFTVRTAVLTTVLAAALATALALRVRRAGTVVRTLLALPVPVPHLLVATVAVLWLAPGGLAERAIGALPVTLVRDEHGVGIVLVYLYKEVPFLLVLLLAALGRGHAERDEAAAALGLSPLQRLRWVTWPTIRGPLLLGCVVVFAFVLGAFDVPLAVGPTYPQTIAEYALGATQGDVVTGQSTAAAALLLAAAVSVVLAALAVRAARGLRDA